MTDDPIERIRKAVTARKRAEAKERDAIVAALRTPGILQADIARASGYSREHLRRIAREHGIESKRGGKETA